MKIVFLTLRVVFALTLAVLSHFVSAENVAINVGATQLALTDPQRLTWDGGGQRPITTHLFYPTRDNTSEPVVMGASGEALFLAGEVGWNVKPVDVEPLPLILMSHGTGGSALQMLWLAERLVKNGYLVAAVNHHGNTAFEAKQYAEGSVLWWERAKDLDVALQALSDHKTWSTYIDQNSIGVIGFSLGGYTAISAIGGITDRALYETFCASDARDFTCEPQVEFANVKAEFEKVKDSDIVQASLQRQHRSYKIGQLKAALVLAPAVAQALTETSLQKIAIPVSVVVGTQDKTTPPATNAKRIATLIPNASYTEIKDAAHYTFLATCTELGQHYLKALCDDSATLNKTAVHQAVSEQAVKFFNAALDYSNALHTINRAQQP